MDNKKNSENKSYTPQGYIAELRKTVKIPKDKEEEVRKQLSPLFTDFYPSSAKFLLYKKYESNFAEKTKKASQTLSQLFEIVSSFREATTEITTEDELKKKRKSAIFLDAMNYLLDVELIGSAFVDQTILLLVAGGACLHLEPDYDHRYVRHFTSLEDLESPSLSLSAKLDFLECNGLTFFSKWIDRTLRNKIAHLDFEIDEEYHFKASNKRVDLHQRLATFMEYYGAIQIVFAEEEAKTQTHKT